MLRALTLTAVAFAALPGGAMGASAFLTNQNGTPCNTPADDCLLVYGADPGETNDIQATKIGDTVTIVDTGATITAESGCTSVSPQEVTCGSAAAVFLGLGDLDDSVHDLERYELDRPRRRGERPDHALHGLPGVLALRRARGRRDPRRERRRLAHGRCGERHARQRHRAGRNLPGRGGRRSRRRVRAGYGELRGLHEPRRRRRSSHRHRDRTGTDSLEGIEDFVGTRFDDRITGNGGANVLAGLGGDDLLVGKAGVDLLVGGPHDDRLFGEADSDRLRGEGGADLLVGGRDRDTLFAGPGTDTLLARDSVRDLLRGQRGVDRARVDAGLDRALEIELFF